jgi:hypothetical protein
LLPREAGALDPPGDTLLRDGGVKGRNPPPLLAGADWVMPRCDPTPLEPIFGEPIFVRPEVAGLDERLLLGGVNEGYPLRFPFCVDEGGLTPLRFAELFIPLPLWNVPALGFCIVPVAGMPRNPAEPPALARPPAGIAPT